MNIVIFAMNAQRKLKMDETYFKHECGLIMDRKTHNKIKKKVVFDKFEVISTLVYADLTFHPKIRNSIWGPPGRFAWKRGRSIERNPFADVIAEADLVKEQWPPIKCGLFKGSYKRFKQIADGYIELLNQLHWY